MRPPLTPEERQALTDPGTLAKATAAAPFELRDRTISNLRIPNLALDHARFIGVDFLNVEFVGTRFNHAVFDSAVFKKCRLEQVAFQSSTISRWALEQSGLNQTQFDRCELRSGRAVNTEMVQVKFQDCLLEGFENLGSSFERPSFIRVRLVGPQWKSTTLRHPRLETVSFENGDLRDVALTESQCRELTLHRMNVEGLAFQFGELAGIGLEGIRGGTVGLADLSCHGLRLEAGDLGGLSFAGVSGSNFTVERCPVTMITMIYSEIDGLRVSHCNLADVSIRKSRVSGDSFFEGCTLVSLDLSESQLAGLALRSTTLNRRLNPRSAAHPLPLHVEAARSSPPLVHGDLSSIAHDPAPVGPTNQVAKFQPSAQAKSESASAPVAAQAQPQSPPQQLATPRKPQKAPAQSAALKASTWQPRLSGAPRPMLSRRVLAGVGALVTLLLLAIGYRLSGSHSAPAPTRSSPPIAPHPPPAESLRSTTHVAPVKPAPEENAPVTRPDPSPASSFADPKASPTAAIKGRGLARDTDATAQAIPAEPPRKLGRSRLLQQTNIPIE